MGKLKFLTLGAHSSSAKHSFKTSEEISLRNTAMLEPKETQKKDIYRVTRLAIAVFRNANI